MRTAQEPEFSIIDAINDVDVDPFTVSPVLCQMTTLIAKTIIRSEHHQIFAALRNKLAALASQDPSRTIMVVSAVCRSIAPHIDLMEQRVAIGFRDTIDGTLAIIAKTHHSTKDDVLRLSGSGAVFALLEQRIAMFGPELNLHMSPTDKLGHIRGFDHGKQVVAGEGASS